MKKIKLYIAASIDGYIARSDGELDWLMKFPVTPNENYGYNDFDETVDTVIMGGRTYRDILCMDFVWPYKGKKTYVISRTQLMKKDDVEFMTENIIENISQLRETEGKDIWLVGGGEIIAMLLDKEMVEEMIITYIPVTLGNGIRLFSDCSKESKWTLRDTKSYPNNVLQATYSLSK
jgi:dihydrofolate reductase